MNKYDAAANIALFLTTTKGSCCATFKGKLTAKEQRAMFGAFIGKGQLIINGALETITHIISACFGLDYDVTFESTFNKIEANIAKFKAIN